MFLPFQPLEAALHTTFQGGSGQALPQAEGRVHRVAYVPPLAESKAEQV